MPVQSVGANNFQKREAHIETESESKYPQIIAIEAQGEKVGLFDNLKPGDVADFAINLRGREWNSPQGETKVFNTIVAWKVEVKGQEASQHQFSQHNQRIFPSNMTAYEIHRHNKAVIISLQKKVLLDNILLSSRAKRIVDDLNLTTLHDLGKSWTWKSCDLFPS
jgi:single-strand DNA-binding protein